MSNEYKKYLREVNSNHLLIRIANNQLIIKKSLETLKSQIMNSNIGRFIPQHRDKCYCQLKCQCGSKIVTETLKSNHKFTKTNLPNVKFIQSEEKKFIPKKSSDFSDDHESLMNRSDRLPKSSSRNFHILEDVHEEKRGPNNLLFTTRRKYYEVDKRQADKLATETPNNELTKPIYTYDDKQLEEISKFRLENSDECVHILNKYSHKRMLEKRDIQHTDDEHTCVHRYTINNRLFPVPILKDDKGQSLCVTCKKISKHLIQENITPISLQNGVNNSKSQTNTIDTINLNENNNNDDNNIVPTIILEIQVNENGDNVEKNLEVKASKSITSVKKKNISDTNLKMFKEHQMPANSLALRYQKRYP